ncbi:MAG: Hsp20 family protein [Pseudomonas fluorescens]|nr:Hsp20 family protein [Pseudomonas fluorescens]
MAVAGFTEDEIALTSENNMLTVAAAKAGKEAEGKRTFLHQGIAQRAFKLSFRLADHIEIKAADLSNGLLSIDLLRVIPEEAKAKRIPINGTQKPALQH